MTHRQGQHDVGRGEQGKLQPPLPPGGSLDLLGFFPDGADAPQVPSGGMPGGGGDQPEQPPVPICAPPHEGRHFNP